MRILVLFRLFCALVGTRDALGGRSRRTAARGPRRRRSRGFARLAPAAQTPAPVHERLFLHGSQGDATEHDKAGFGPGKCLPIYTTRGTVKKKKKESNKKKPIIKTLTKYTKKR